MPEEVAISPRDPERFRDVLPPERYNAFERENDEARSLLAGRVVWNVNSPARGGGVVELLRPLLGYARGAGIDTRWVVIDGTPEFFDLTKRIHNRLHGSAGDGGRLGSREHAIYEAVTLANAASLAELVSPGDVVLLHDPQTAGMAGALIDAGAHVIWRCHVGLDEPNRLVRSAWRFLEPYVEPAQAYVFS